MVENIGITILGKEVFGYHLEPVDHARLRWAHIEDQAEADYWHWKEVLRSCKATGIDVKNFMEAHDRLVDSHCGPLPRKGHWVLFGQIKELSPYKSLH